ncbi:hypothetical protein EDC04DRAFT_2917210 [Pisolithus marmoratus]|nr:hypothetical protein EDC04DRAFT_2917210 [Pisolithus marmoratus]
MRGSDAICSIAVSQDGQWIVSGDDGNQAIVWNATTHEKVLHVEHEAYIFAVDISSDCTKVVTASWAVTDTARIFDITSGTDLFPLVSPGHLRGIKFSPDGSRFATASFYDGVRVYSTHNGDILFDSDGRGRIGADPPLAPLAWSSNGQQLFVVGRGKITCFDFSKSSSSDWWIHETESRAFIASNGRFVACSAGSSVSLWDCVSHEQIGSIISYTAEIRSIALSPSGGYLACSVGKNITIHDLRDVLPLTYFVGGLPLVQVSGETLKSWTQGDLTSTEMLLSEEITSTSSPNHYLLANRALVQARSNHVALAIEDGKESLRIQPSPIGYIATAVALLGQGDREGALWAFDLAFHDCEPHDNRLLLLLKSILLFESGNQEVAIARVEHLITRVNDDDATYLYTQARASLVLGVMYMKKRNYERAIPLIERAKNLAPEDKQCPPLMTISLWRFIGLEIVAQQHQCEILYAEGRTTEAVEILLDIISTSDEEIQRSKATSDWVSDFVQKCVMTLERVGDKALDYAEHVDALVQYPATLSLSPANPAGLFMKRSRARAAKGLWEGALQDANGAVKADPSNPWCYEAKYAALHGAKRYDEAIDAFQFMLDAIEQSHDPEIRQLRKNYISPSQTIAAIDSITREVLKSCPLVVIDVTSGCLCDRPQRMRIFKADPSFKELVSSMTRKLDNERIRQLVAKFFGYVMFSHAWQGNEPSFREVNVAKSVWDLPEAPLNEKLRNFCRETRRRGHNWAWSDTCCIDKAASSILNQSLTSMYKWYADSAATLVFLAGVAHPPKPGDLTGSLWMTRAWTLQELLAPKIIFFYDSEWKPYLNDTGENHKESPEIMQELANAIKIPRGTITTFSPDDLEVRDKLRLASTRNATVEEDVAYSLIGIFKSDIRPHYGEGADALGHLLEEIVTRFGEVTVLAWSGKSSSYNSCLPASISVYNQTPSNPPSLEGEEMKTYLTELRGKLSREVVLSIYNQINCLQPVRFAARRLHLPCIVFSIRKLGIQETRNDNEKVYHARVSGLGTVEFTTADDLPLQRPQKLVFAHPWIPYIRGPSDGDTWEGDSESVVDFGSDSEYDTGSYETVPPSPLDATPALQVDDYTQALQMIARLGQPFNALLLVQQPDRHYRRVATENEIVVPGLGTDVTSQNVRATTLEIL